MTETKKGWLRSRGTYGSWMEEIKKAYCNDNLKCEPSVQVIKGNLWDALTKEKNCGKGAEREDCKEGKAADICGKGVNGVPGNEGMNGDFLGEKIKDDPCWEKVEAAVRKTVAEMISLNQVSMRIPRLLLLLYEGNVSQILEDDNLNKNGDYLEEQSDNKDFYRYGNVFFGLFTNRFFFYGVNLDLVKECITLGEKLKLGNTVDDARKVVESISWDEPFEAFLREVVLAGISDKNFSYQLLQILLTTSIYNNEMDGRTPNDKVILRELQIACIHFLRTKFPEEFAEAIMFIKTFLT